MQNNAPIVLFVYNRVDNLKTSIEALLKNKESKDSDLIIYSDGPKNTVSAIEVCKVREFIHSISGFKSITIIERVENWGLAKNVIDGISSVVKKYGKVIVLEDDIVTSPYFLKFMNEALERYKDCEDVASVQGFTFPVDETLPEAFFTKCCGCWGWATWQRAWNLFNENASFLYDELKRRNLAREFNLNDTYSYMKMLKDQRDGKINSWAIRWYASVFLAEKFALNPGRSFVFNCGFNGRGGTHNTTENHQFDTTLTDKPIDWDKIGEIAVSNVGTKAYERFLKKTNLGKGSKIGRLFHHLHIDFLMLGFLKRYRWED